MAENTDTPQTNSEKVAPAASDTAAKRRSPVPVILLVLFGIVLTVFLAALASYSVSSIVKRYLPVQLHLSDKGDSREVGLPVYPGATVIEDNDDDDSASAHIQAMAGDVGLKVAAASYQSADAPDKVLAFYRNALAPFGKVTACAGDVNVGGDDDKDKAGDDKTVDKDSKDQGRTHLDINIQDENSNIRIRGGDHKGLVITGNDGLRCTGDAHDGQVLKAGTAHDFHMVKVQADGSGSRFSMVYVRLKGFDK